MVDVLLLLVSTLAAIEVLVFGLRVGRGRIRHRVPAPSTSGPPDWERLNRIHLNSIEQLVVFLPLFLAFATTVDKTWAVWLGFLFVAARAAYAVGYARSPEGRFVGAALTSLVQVLLALGAIVGIVYRLVR